MKIVYISNSIIPSRAANSIHVMKMCQAYANNGHEVTLLAPDLNEKYEDDVSDIYKFYNVKNNFKIVKLSAPNLKGRTLFYCLSIFKYLLFNKVDLVYGRYILGCYMATLLGLKTIFESHTPIFEENKLSKCFFNKIIKSKNFKKFVVISEALKEKYIEKGYLDKDKIYVAHDGADEVVDFDSKIELFGNSEINVAYIGHLYKGKGMEVIEKLSLALNNVGFHIVGGTNEDIRYWKEKIKNDNVYFYGFVNQNEIKKYINSVDICLLPNQKIVLTHGNESKINISEYTSPLKMFEYMAAKKAIISSDLDVLREVLNENNSILVNYDNIKEWEIAIEKLQDLTFREKISQQAYIDFISKYSWNIRAKKIIDVINNKGKK